MKLPVNIEIARTHITKGFNQTLNASLGVALGVAIYLFMNSLSEGFNKFSRDNIFQSSAHLNIFQEDELSNAMLVSADTTRWNILVNPKTNDRSKRIINPKAIIHEIKREPYITNAISQVDFSLFYTMGKTQLNGNGIGVNM
ncbi:MAG: hypothetical protein HRT74_02830, partial [Flavobacteriales bacterium]|nr:hypothetical protein [Flavobacteriales bacterium]